MIESLVKITEHFARGIEYLPFFSLAIKQQPGEAHELSPRFVARMLEAAIIGGIILYGTVQALVPKIDANSAGISVLQQSNMEQFKELKLEINDIKKDFYVPIVQPTK
jgi:hypothetical protein